MRIAFLGTPQFAVAPLDALARAGHEIVCVVAQPDRPAGRGQALREPATKAWARAHGVDVLQPEKVRDGTLAAALRARAPDVLVVVAYGRILGKDLLTLAPLGAVNVHGSLLPRWRGAAPIQWAVADGDRETGVTIMQMDEGLDTGDMLLQRACAIGDEDTAETVYERLSALGAAAVVEALPLLAAGRLTPVRQDPAQATHAPIIEKEHGRLDFALPAARLASRLRGFTPWPGAFTTVGGKVLKVHRARALAPAELAALGAARGGDAEGAERGAARGGATEGAALREAALAPGEVVVLAGDPRPATRAEPSLVVGCGDGSGLLLLEVQLEGKKRVTAAEFLRGAPIPAGTVLGR